jgi:hypothetical protein
MRVISAVLAVAAWALAEPAMLQAAAAKADPDAVVSIRHQQMGSRIPGKVECHTARVWDQMTDDARRTLEGLQRRTMQHMQ